MRAHPLPEARAYADLMLTELRKVIPSFLKRVDLDDRGVAWSNYLGDNRDGHGRRRRPALPDRRRRRRPGAGWCTLVDFDPDAEVKLVASHALPVTSTCPRTRSRTGCGPCRSTSAWP